MSPDLPLEFVVYGIAVSHQAANAKRREEWKDTVRDAARPVLPEGHWTIQDPVAVTIYIFPQAKMQGDIDNSAKLILDAMSAYIYLDDSLVERLVVQKFEPDRPLDVGGNTTDVLAEALSADQPVVYVKVSDDLRAE